MYAPSLVSLDRHVRCVAVARTEVVQRGLSRSVTSYVVAGVRFGRTRTTATSNPGHRRMHQALVVPSTEVVLGTTSVSFLLLALVWCCRCCRALILIKDFIEVISLIFHGVWFCCAGVYRLGRWCCAKPVQHPPQPVKLPAAHKGRYISKKGWSIPVRERG